MAAPVLGVNLSKSLPALADELARGLASPPEVAKAAAFAVTVAASEHLRRRDGTAKHREGFPRTGYWHDVADSATTEIRGNNAVVRFEGPGLALHYHGGVVRPVRGRALAIPARPEAAGRNPREFMSLSARLSLSARAAGRTALAERLRDRAARTAVTPRKALARLRVGNSFFLWWPKGRSVGALARRDAGGHLTIFWWLVGATHHEPDPTVLPDQATIEAAAVRGAKLALSGGVSA